MFMHTLQNLGTKILTKNATVDLKIIRIYGKPDMFMFNRFTSAEVYNSFPT